MLLLPWVQIPLFISMSLTLRCMCGYEPWSLTLKPSYPPLEGLADPASASGMWFHDLLSTDPTLISPLLLSLVHILNIHVRSLVIEVYLILILI